MKSRTCRIRRKEHKQVDVVLKIDKITGIRIEKYVTRANEKT